MNEHDPEYENMKAKIAKRGRILIIAGLLVFVTGIILFVVGITSSGGFGLSAIGGFTFVIGFGIAGFGMQFYLASKAGKISRYFAKATGDSAKYTSEKVTDGFATGLKKHGMGIGGREVIKVKCRNCGYLETEDAEFCSKCGQTI